MLNDVLKVFHKMWKKFSMKYIDIQAPGFIFKLSNPVLLEYLGIYTSLEIIEPVA